MKRFLLGLVFSGMVFTCLFGQNASSTLKIKQVKALPFLLTKNNSEFQPVKINADLQVDSCSAVVSIEGNKPVTLHFRKGENNVEVPVKAVSSEKKSTVKIESGGILLYKGVINLRPVRKLTCYIVPMSHTDIGYTEIQTAIEDKQVQNLVKGIELAKKTANYPEGAKFIWNVEVSWAADLYLKRLNDVQKKEFLDAVKRGDVSLNGMYLNLLTGLSRPEELSRLFKFSTGLAQKTNVPITSAMTSDVPGQTWGTVTAMSQAGIRYFSSAPNYFDRIGDILAKWENKAFYWASPTGKEKVLVWVPYKGYALSHIIRKFTIPFAETFVNLLDSTKYPYDIIYVRWAGHGDNAVPDGEISEFVKDWVPRYTWPKFVISSCRNAFESFEKRYGRRLPVVKGDWTPYWEDGAGSSALETGMNRASSDRLSQAEALWAMKDPASYPREEFEEAWKKVLLYSEHTWGAWCSVSDPENKMTKEQWDIKKSYALDADKQSGKLLEQALALESKSGLSDNAVDIINTNSWSRSEIVVIPGALSKGGDRVTDENRNPVLSQRLSNGDLAIEVKSISPYSVKRFFVEAGKAYASESIKINGATIDNGLISVQVDSNSGAISQLKLSGKENNFVNLSSGYGLNDYAFLDSVKLNDIRRINKVKISVKENGPLVASLFIASEAEGCNKLTREVRLLKGQDHVELVNVLDKKRAQVSSKPGNRTFAQKGGKESINFAFPFNVPGGAIHMDIPYATIRPEKDQIPGSCKNWLTASRWADVSNGETGITLVTLDAPLFEVGGITATMLGSQTNPEIWRKHIEPTQTLFSWVINNHWGTNYRAYQDGLITFRYALWPHKQYSPSENSRYAVGLSQPLLVKQASENQILKPAGIYPENPEVLITALKPCDDGKGRIMTLFNSTSSAIKTKLITKNITLGNLWITDLGEGKKQKVSNNISFLPWETRMVRVE